MNILTLSPIEDDGETKMNIPTVSCLSPWFGSNRMLGPEVGKALAGCEWVGIPFCGGMSEVPHITARALLVNDLHRDIINLARITADDDSRAKLIKDADSDNFIFHPDNLRMAQELCKKTEPLDSPHYTRALLYFVACWMGRSGKSGTDSEFDGGFAMRFTASGGGSNVRYRSAIESLEAWGKTLKRCEFSCLDFRDFLAKCHDRPKYGIYVDAPWPDDGDGYRHKFTEDDHRTLADWLGRFEYTRVVVRFGDHELIRSLYPESDWTWNMLTSRTQANEGKSEALIINRAV